MKGGSQDLVSFPNPFSFPGIYNKLIIKVFEPSLTITEHFFVPQDIAIIFHLHLCQLVGLCDQGRVRGGLANVQQTLQPRFPAVAANVSFQVHHDIWCGH